jgi:hypothetical protein
MKSKVREVGSKWHTPKEPRGQENENASQRAQTRWRVKQFDIEEIFLSEYHLNQEPLTREQTLEYRRTSSQSQFCMPLHISE